MKPRLTYVPHYENLLPIRTWKRTNLLFVKSEFNSYNIPCRKFILFRKYRSWNVKFNERWFDKTAILFTEKNRKRIRKERNCGTTSIFFHDEKGGKGLGHPFDALQPVSAPSRCRYSPVGSPLRWKVGQGHPRSHNGGQSHIQNRQMDRNGCRCWSASLCR